MQMVVNGIEVSVTKKAIQYGDNLAIVKNVIATFRQQNIDH